MNCERRNSQILKFTPSGSKDKGIRKLKLVAELTGYFSKKLNRNKFENKIKI